MLTGDNGILLKTNRAKEKTIEVQYEEELNLVISTIRTDAINKSENFNMEYIIQKLPEYLEAEGKLDYIWDIEDQEIEEPGGEYKDYIFYIDKNYVAHIEAKVNNNIQPDKPTIQIEAEKKALEYPTLNKNGMMTCYYSIKEGQNVLLKITNKRYNVTNYYSIDGGNNWIKYENQINIIYPGAGNLLAKSINSNELESEIATAEVVEETQYLFDKNILPTAVDALDIAAYDGDRSTYWDPDSEKSSKRRFLIDNKNIDMYQVCFDLGESITESAVVYEWPGLNVGIWVNRFDERRVY